MEKEFFQKKCKLFYRIAVKEKFNNLGIGTVDPHIDIIIMKLYLITQKVKYIVF